MALDLRRRGFARKVLGVETDPVNATAALKMGLCDEVVALEECVRSASTKRYSRARMRRILLCAALGVHAEDALQAPPYARLLSCSERGRAYLGQASNSFTIPLLTKPAAARRMDEESERIFELGASAHELYRLQFVTDDDKTWGTDWRTGPFIG